jgi:hypothetical protein
MINKKPVIAKDPSFIMGKFGKIEDKDKFS